MSCQLKTIYYTSHVANKNTNETIRPFLRSIMKKWDLLWIHWIELYVGTSICIKNMPFNEMKISKNVINVKLKINVILS